jgi:hypothetical protein
MLIYQGLIPLAELRSVKAIALELPPRGATVAVLGDYPTSAGYYSGYIINKLEENGEEMVPEGPWSGKYTMPTETVAAFNTRTIGNPNTYILVSEGNKLTLAGFQPVARDRKYTLYKRE